MFRWQLRLVDMDGQMQMDLLELGAVLLLIQLRKVLMVWAICAVSLLDRGGAAGCVRITFSFVRFDLLCLFGWS